MTEDKNEQSLFEFKETEKEFIDRCNAKNNIFTVEKIKAGTFGFEVVGIKVENEIIHLEVEKHLNDPKYIQFLYVPEMQHIELCLKEDFPPRNAFFSITGTIIRHANSTSQITGDISIVWQPINPNCPVHNPLR